jgi:XTP/dITP diphosphohydrolase
MNGERKTSPEFELRRLMDIVSKLRGPEGCPWDLEQTPESMIPYLLEEAYEVVESIEDGKQEEIVSELGDLLLHIVMQAQMAA